MGINGILSELTFPRLGYSNSGMSETNGNARNATENTMSPVKYATHLDSTLWDLLDLLQDDNPVDAEWFMDSLLGFAVDMDVTADYDRQNGI